MFQSNRFWLLFVSLLIMYGCNGEPEPPPEKKDLLNFTLPDRVKQEAPHMQAHLYRMVPYNSFRFPVKPEFAFLDLDQITQGRPNPAVRRFNFLHLAYFKKGAHIWSGSMMMSPEKGQMMTSLKGYLIGVNSKGGQIKMDFRDGELMFEDRFPYDQDYEYKNRGDDITLYVNYYTFPDDMIRPKLTPKSVLEPKKVEVGKEEEN